MSDKLHRESVFVGERDSHIEEENEIGREGYGGRIKHYVYVGISSLENVRLPK